MYRIKLKKDGTLYKSNKPAIYADTNFLWRYFNADSLELVVDGDGNILEEELKKEEEIFGKDERGEYLRNFVKAEGKLYDMAYIRHLNILGLTQVSFVMTPINLLELYKIHAEILFKNICADKMSAKRIQRWSEKEVGRYLAKLLAGLDNNKDDKTLRYLFSETFFNTSFAMAHGLHAIFYVPDLKLKLTEKDIYRFLCILSYLQLDPVDILHLQAAKQLNCDYFASFDSGFNENKERILESLGIQVLFGTKAIIDILKQYPNKKKIPKVR